MIPRNYRPLYYISFWSTYLLAIHVKAFMSEIIQCLKFVFKISSKKRGDGRDRWNNIGNVIVIAEADNKHMEFNVLYSLLLYIFLNFHNENVRNSCI